MKKLALAQTPPRRDVSAGAPKKLRLFVALVVLMPLVIVFSGTPAVAEKEHVDCMEPIPVGSYDESRFSYDLVFDYSTCSWWDGSAVELDATLARLDAEGEEIANVVSHCGALAFGDVAREKRGLCEVEVDLEHPVVEVARYQGEITFPWGEGPRTVGFTVLCAAPALECQEP